MVHVVHNKDDWPVVDVLVYRAALESDGGSTASHGINHRESKGFRPINGKQIGVSVAQEFTLLLVVNLADEFDIRRGQQVLDFAFVVGAIHAVDFGRNLKRHVEFDGDFDGTVNPLLRRYAT